MTIPRGPAYYDASYERIIRLMDPVVWGLMRERCTKISPYILGDCILDTVLDVACGLGILADYVGEQAYFGVDFSSVAIGYALYERSLKDFSTDDFIQEDAFKFLSETDLRFDTVILSEILEHVAQPARLYELAAAVATKRIIWTVPWFLPSPAHVWPAWPEQSIDLLLSIVDGECVVKERFGGEGGKRWWIVVQDVKK